MMKLFLLSPRRDLSFDKDPWEPWYDKSFGFVIREINETEARKRAAANGGDEGEENGVEFSPWLSEEYSLCEELTAEGEPGTILRDFASA